MSDDALGAWVAHCEGRLVGHVALHEQSLPVVMSIAGEALGRADHELAVVARLIVDPAARRCGAGRALLDVAATAARDLGRHPILDVVRADNCHRPRSSEPDSASAGPSLLAQDIGRRAP